jgi:non-specific serine/threonine protein kinase
MNVDEAIAAALAPPQPEPSMSEPTTLQPNAALAVLTPRERQVAALVAGGLTNKQIAAQLVVSDRTADVHVSNILGKLELTSRAQLAVWAVTHGLPGVRLPT